MTEHSENPVYRNRFQILLDKFLSYLTSGIIAVSNSVVVYHRKRQNINQNLFKVIYNGLELTGRNPSQLRAQVRKKLGIFHNNTIVLGNVARLSREKNHEYYLKIIAELPHEKLPVIGLIVGDGDQRQKLENIVDNLDIKDKIIFTGERYDVGELLSAMDIWLSTSKMEGYSVDVLEAMYAGLPVMVPDVGGNSEAVQNGNTGLIIGKSENMDVTVKRIKKLITDKGYRKILGSAGHQRVKEKFTFESMIHQTESYYYSLA